MILDTFRERHLDSLVVQAKISYRKVSVTFVLGGMCLPVSLHCYIIKVRRSIKPQKLICLKFFSSIPLTVAITVEK